MQPTFSELKKAAKNALKRHWLEAIAVCLLVAAVILTDLCFQYTLMSVFTVEAVWSVVNPFAVPDNSTVASICISVLSSLYWLCVIMPLSLGVLRWFWKTTGGSDVGVDEVFHYFSSGAQFRRSVLLSVSLFVRTILAAALFYLPGTVAGLLSNPEVYSALGLTMPLGLSGLTAVEDVLGFISTVVFTVWIMRYVMFFPVYFENPDMKVSEVIKQAVEITRGGKIRFIAFALSFTLLLLACLFVVPTVFVFPFIMASLCIYGREEYRYYRFKLENSRFFGVNSEY